MNFASEKNKPIFVARPFRITQLCARDIINEALANCSASEVADSGDFVIKAAAARRLPKETLVSLAESTETEIRDLVISRFKAAPDENFSFLDGRTFTAGQAAEEVRRGTAEGNYFLELEKETLRIVQRAYSRGELS